MIGRVAIVTAGNCHGGDRDDIDRSRGDRNDLVGEDQSG